MMRNDQWSRFTDLVDKADCRASLIRLCMLFVRVILNNHSDYAPGSGYFSLLLSFTSHKIFFYSLFFHTGNKVPLCVHDAHSFICAQHGAECPRQGELCLLWSSQTGEEKPMLVGAKQGAEREQYIEHLKQFAELLEAEKEKEIDNLTQEK